jgi:hypothetical protein
MFTGTFKHLDPSGNVLREGTYEEASLSFAAANFTGRLVRVADTATAIPEVAEPPPVGAVTRTVAAGTVSEEARERQARVNEALRTIGIVPTPPVYAAGSVVNDTGVENFRLSRMEFDKLPSVADAVADVKARIAAEKRADILVPVRDLRMNPDGSITRGSGDVWLEKNGLRQLLSRAKVFPDAYRVMEAAPPSARASFFNDMIKHYADTTLKDTRVTLRGRMNPDTGRPQAYAFVGPSYAAFDGDRVIGTLVDVFGRNRDTRAEIVYDPSDTSIRADVLYHADRMVDLSAADVFKGGFRLRTADDASSSIRGGGLAYRNLCLNLIIVATETSDLFRRIHRGSVGDVAASVREAAERVVTAFDAFAGDWGKLRQTDIAKVEVYGVTYSSVPDALTGLVDAGRIDLAVARDTAVEWLLSGYEAEPGETLADLINAVTRIHSVEKVPAYAVERAEDAAGLLARDLALA